MSTPFDRDPDAYDAVRPGYPAALVDDVCALVPARALLVEAGCGTGQATRLFAARGRRIVAVDAGPRMAERARQNVAAYDVDVRVGRFEDVPLPTPVDLVYSATAWHWIDPTRGYAKAASLLRAGGPLALFWNIDALDQQERFAEHYARAGMSRRPGVPDHTREIVDSGCFAEVTRKQYPWTSEYDTATYVRLLSTYSDHMRLADDVRARLFDGIADSIERDYGGRIIKHYLADLYIARAIKRA